VNHPGDQTAATPSPQPEPPFGPPPPPPQQPPQQQPPQQQPEPVAVRAARVGRTALLMLGIVVAVTALGAPFGLLWTAFTPDVPVVVTARGPVYGVAQPEQLIAADGWFAILALPVGLVAAVGVWLLARAARGAVGLFGVTLGAVGTGLLAWWVGRQIGLADYESTVAAAEAGARLDQPPDLAVVELGWWPPRVLGVLLVPALAAAATYTMLAAWSRFPDLRPEPEPEDHPNVGDIGVPGPS
jgi:hypothetical protein